MGSFRKISQDLSVKGKPRVSKNCYQKQATYFPQPLKSRGFPPNSQQVPGAVGRSGQVRGAGRPLPPARLPRLFAWPPPRNPLFREPRPFQEKGSNSTSRLKSAFPESACSIDLVSKTGGRGRAPRATPKWRVKGAQGGGGGEGCQSWDLDIALAEWMGKKVCDRSGVPKEFNVA